MEVEESSRDVVRKPCTTPGGAETHPPGPSGTLLVVDEHRELAFQDVERIRVLLVDVRVRSGRALSNHDSVTQSCSKAALSTIRPPKSDSPSPAR